MDDLIDREGLTPENAILVRDPVQHVSRPDVEKGRLRRAGSAGSSLSFACRVSMSRSSSSAKGALVGTDLRNDRKAHREQAPEVPCQIERGLGLELVPKGLEPLDRLGARIGCI